MPRKTVREQKQKRPSDADLNRIRPVLDDLIGKITDTLNFSIIILRLFVV